ncbi:lipoyl(octanoyl) transferase LipB [Granulicoccus phenolivorans]|uniref:lipoyl(octanoyl) transferase LipB n=1 Tax=Granulicoccus phenolivorans TaxID=266854 RepID=UPI00040CFC7A|nr:lipoyl(octanoyl) transferase LipB [Granulicoccus phenolivorans]
MALDFRYLGITDNPVTLTDYQQAWDLQREIHRQVSQGELGDTVLYLEHPPTYTAGRRTEPHERPVDGTPVIDVDRGGKITWHGPGQLVGYPIVRIPDDGVGVVDYIRRVEEAVIRCLAEYGLTTGRVKGRSGVWLSATATKPERKVCAIGIRVAHHTTMHGFALTVSSDLGDFGKIVPCGIDDAGVTSLADELDDPPTVVEVARALEPYLTELLSWQDYEKSPDLHPEPTGVSYGLQLQS